MNIVKYLRFLTVNSKVIFRSDGEIQLKVNCVPNNTAIKLEDGETIWAADKEDLDSIKKTIEVYFAAVDFDDGKGIVQYFSDIKTLTVVLSATKEQISEMMKLNFHAEYLDINIAGKDKDSYLDGNFSVDRDFSVHSWSIGISN